MLLAAALLWATQPGNASTIAWVSCSADPLCLLLGVGAIALWVCGKSPRAWAAAALLWGLALLTKEWAVLWPVVALALLLAQRADMLKQIPPALGDLVRRFWLTVPVFAAWLAVRHAVLGAVLGGPRHGLPAGQQVVLAAAFLARYLNSLVLLHPPALWPTFWPARAASLPLAFAGFAALVALLLWAGWLWRRRQPLAAACALLVPLSLAPALLVTKIPWPIVFNPRYLFFATPFFAVALAATLMHRLSARQALWTTVALAALSAGLQLHEIGLWRDPGTFFQAAAARSPRSAVAIEELAAIRAREARQGRPQELDWALAGDLRAAALTRGTTRPELIPTRLLAETGAAEILLARHRVAAVRQLLAPADTPASPERADARIANALAGADIGLGRFRQAQQVLAAALASHPDDYGLHARQAYLLARQGNCPAAESESARAAQLATPAFAASAAALTALIHRTCGE